MLTREELKLLLELAEQKEQEALTNAKMWTAGGKNHKELMECACVYTVICGKLEYMIERMKNDST